MNTIKKIINIALDVIKFVASLVVRPLILSSTVTAKIITGRSVSDDDMFDYSMYMASVLCYNIFGWHPVIPFIIANIRYVYVLFKSWYTKIKEENRIKDINKAKFTKEVKREFVNYLIQKHVNKTNNKTQTSRDLKFKKLFDLRMEELRNVINSREDLFVFDNITFNV